MFSDTLKSLRIRSGKSRYALSQFSGIDQAYLLRLESGERANPSRDVVLMVALALVYDCSVVGIDDIDELLLAAGYAPLTRYGLKSAAVAF